MLLWAVSYRTNQFIFIVWSEILMSNSITMKVDIRSLVLQIKRNWRLILFIEDNSFKILLVENLLDFFLWALSGRDRCLYPKTLLLPQSVFIERLVLFMNSSITTISIEWRPLVAATVETGSHQGWLLIRGDHHGIVLVAGQREMLLLRIHFIYYEISLCISIW